MELLDKKDYNKVSEPLRQVTFNTLFARSVVEQKVNGKIYADNIQEPKTFYVIHPYGMTLLLGNSDNQLFNAKFKRYALNTDRNRSNHEWMQAYPGNWGKVLNRLFDDCLIKSSLNENKLDHGVVELNTRVNFRFNKKQYLSKIRAYDDQDIVIMKADRQMIRDMEGSVVPIRFCNSEDDFLKTGLAYALFYKGELASMAFSSFWFGDQFEFGIETKSRFRGKGFAELVCSSLIDYCISNRYEPIWACRLENTGSYKLAQKLGFEPAFEIPYYRLSN